MWRTIKGTIPKFLDIVLCPVVCMFGVAQVDVENLQLTKFRQFWQLVGRYCSYLLDGWWNITNKT